MQQFIEKYKDHIVGILSGFDRLVFHGSLRRLNYGRWDKGLQAFVARGMEEYLWQNKILFKNYRDHVKAISERLKRCTVEPLKKQKVPVVFLRDSKTDKDALARELAAQRKVESGTVCVISALEPSPTFEHTGLHIIRRLRPCHVLYHYQIHEEVGWMHARIQTWFPFNIQIAINGREWLARQMDKVGLRYRKHGNCFAWLQDYERAQELLEGQLQTDWAQLLGGFSKQLNPIQESVFERYPSDYYWTTFQSEWATDVVFKEADFLKRLMPLLVRHGMLSFASADVLRYFGRKVNQSGAIPANFNGKLQVDMKRRQEGERVKYQMNGNSAKFYDKAYSEFGGVLRAAETTINTVNDLRVYRPKEGGPPEDLQWRPMRKGIADLHRRTTVSQKANDRLMDALASVDDSHSVEELTRAIQEPVSLNGRRIRALRPWGEDHELFKVLNDGSFFLNGFRNRDLRQRLYQTEAVSDEEDRRRSAKVGRLLRILRAHHVIQRVSRTHRYEVTAAARRTITAVLATARTTLQQLNQLGNAA
jgi:hypothetical protein